MTDFESKFKSRSYMFDPNKGSVKNPMDGNSGELQTPYYGPTLGPPVVEEIRVWTQVLMAIKDGVPKPFDNSVIVKKINSLEKKTGEDLTQLKNCCPPSAEVREAKEFKPMIYGILDRIIEIGQIKNYVDKYKQNENY